MLNVIEEAVIARLKSRSSGLPSDSDKPWYVPRGHIRRQPPDMSGRLSRVLPAVCFANVDFTVEESPFEGIGEIRSAGQADLVELRRLKFNLLYHLDIWAEEMDGANEIAQKAVAILLSAREQLLGMRENYQISEMKLVAGRGVPEEREGVFRRQLDYFIESELITEIPQPAIREVTVKEVGWP